MDLENKTFRGINALEIVQNGNLSILLDTSMDIADDMAVTAKKMKIENTSLKISHDTALLITHLNNLAQILNITNMLLSVGFNDVIND